MLLLILPLLALLLSLSLFKFDLFFEFLTATNQFTKQRNYKQRAVSY